MIHRIFHMKSVYTKLNMHVMPIKSLSRMRTRSENTLMNI